MQSEHKEFLESPQMQKLQSQTWSNAHSVDFDKATVRKLVQKYYTSLEELKKMRGLND